MSHMKTTTPFLPDCQSWWPLQPGLDFLASCWGLIWASLVLKALAYHYLFNVERWYQCLQRASHPKKVAILTLFWQLSRLKVEIWHWNAHHVNVCCFCSTDCSYSGTNHVRFFWQRAAGARSFDDLMLIFLLVITYSGKWFQCVSMSWTFSTGRGCPGMFSILEFETCGSARPEHAETKVLDIVWNMCLLVLCSTEAIGSIHHWWQNYFEHWIKTIGIGVHFISRLMQRLVSTGCWQKLSQWVIQWVWQFSQHFDSILINILIISPILSTSFYHPFLSIWVCLKMVYPYTQWLMIIIPIKWLSLGIYSIFRHTHFYPTYPISTMAARAFGWHFGGSAGGAEVHRECPGLRVLHKLRFGKDRDLTIGKGSSFGKLTYYIILYHIVSYYIILYCIKTYYLLASRQLRSIDIQLCHV